MDLIALLLIALGFQNVTGHQASSYVGSDPLVPTLPVHVEALSETLFLIEDVKFEPTLDANQRHAYIGRMSSEDTMAFAEFTGRYVGEQITLYVCDTMLVEATLRTQILSGDIMLVGEDGVLLLESFLRDGCP